VSAEQSKAKVEVIVVGGGVAGLDGLLALRYLAGDRAALTLVSADDEFLGKSHEERREPPTTALDVEVALAKEWHGDPMALDVEAPPEVD
jgi:NAD(P)H-hydrate repair Nnr-like enzyme with NAD(P)H-hydrate epimerase domain